MKNLLFFCLVSILFFSCQKESDVTIKFNHHIDGFDVNMNSYNHYNQVGQTFGITKLQYYISEITFLNDDGSKSSTLTGGHLIDLSEETTLSFLAPIEQGVYTKMEFQFGISKANNVESYLENTVENQNMFWPVQMEEAGEKGAYHYMKLEGRYFMSSADSIKPFVYHFGPTNGADNSFKVSFDIDEMKTRGKSLELSVDVDLQQWFENPTSYNFDDYSNVMMNQATQEIYKANGQNVFDFDYLFENE